jgi:hypothetical protein
MKRQACLPALLERSGCQAVSLSEPFEDRRQAELTGTLTPHQCLEFSHLE